MCELLIAVLLEEENDENRNNKEFFLRAANNTTYCDFLCAEDYKEEIKNSIQVSCEQKKTTLNIHDEKKILSNPNRTRQCRFGLEKVLLNW